MTLKELDELLRENPSFIISLQNKCEMQEKEIQKLKDLLGIQTSSADLNIKAVNKIKEQAKEIEQLKEKAEHFEKRLRDTLIDLQVEKDWKGRL